ncbi:MAG: hypothetical protein NVS9B14_20440 [Candidatus Acidiferrum sp.]
MAKSLDQLRDFATRYTAAWCSGNPEAVAAFFTPNGSLNINDGAPSVGRPAIANAARDFMTAFPDLRVFFDDLRQNGPRIEYHWTLTGTNTGPAGTGKKVRISGFESWLFSPEGAIEDSLGHFDAADYQRQLTDDRQ